MGNYTEEAETARCRLEEFGVRDGLVDAVRVDVFYTPDLVGDSLVPMPATVADGGVYSTLWY